MTTPNPNAVKEKMELLPCPFCGCGGHVIEGEYNQITCCNQVGCIIGSRYVKFTRGQWNTRAPSPELTTLRQQNKELVEAAAMVVKGFEENVFVRNTDNDKDSSWAVKLLPYLVALGKLSKLKP